MRVYNQTVVNSWLPPTIGMTHIASVYPKETDSGQNISLTKQEFNPCNSRNCSGSPVKKIYVQNEVHDIHVSRMRHFRDVCVFNNYSKGDVGFAKLWYVPELDLVTKLSPKVGSTFFINAIRYLRSFKSADEVFSKARFLSHIFNYNKDVATFNSQSISKQVALVFARNPYSRLFSAFIDKVYIFNNSKLAKYVKMFVNFKYRRSIKCVLDLEFTDFLRYALYSQNRIIYDHYMPISSLVNLPVICSARNIIIAKQETFSADMDYVFTKSHISQTKREGLNKILSYKKALTSVREIASTVFHKMSTATIIDCLDYQTIAKRLWHSFQIQGYIHEKSPFPKFTFEDSTHCRQFLAFVEVAMMKQPVSSEQAALQRRNAFIAAYSQVDDIYRQEIIKQFSDDFELFQYDPNVLI